MRAGPAECNVATEEAIFASQWTRGSEDPSAQMDRFTHQPVAMGLSAEMGRTPLTHSAPDSLRTYTMFLSLLVQSVSGLLRQQARLGPELLRFSSSWCLVRWGECPYLCAPPPRLSEVFLKTWPLKQCQSSSDLHDDGPLSVCRPGFEGMRSSIAASWWCGVLSGFAPACSVSSSSTL